MQGYWRFYWPLALTGVALVLTVQFQNGILARYPAAVQELAVFALASGVYSFFNASLGFVAQLSNVFARSIYGTRRCWLFVLWVSVGLVLLVLTLGATAPGLRFVQLAYGIDDALTAQVGEYLRLLAPLVLLNGQRNFLNGLLVQAKLTGSVTVINFVYLGTLLSGLFIGLSLGLPAPWVLVGSDALALLVQVGCLLVLWKTRYTLPEQPEHEALSYAELVRFYFPISMTGVMFALSRPVLFAFVARGPEGIVTVAALRIAFDLAAMFQQATNQFRHFFVTFGWEDLRPKRLFMMQVGVGLTLIMLLVAFTPLSKFVWQDLMAVPDSVSQPATAAFAVMCLMPVIILLRNYYHGYLMVIRRTAGMAWASILRVVGIYLYAQLMFSMGTLNATTAAFGLILGFAIEAILVMGLARRERRRQRALGK